MRSEKETAARALLFTPRGTHANGRMLLRTSVLRQKQTYKCTGTSVRRHERSEGRRPRFEGQTHNTHFLKNAPKASLVLLCSSCALQASHVKLKARNTFKPSSKHAMSMPVSAKAKTNSSNTVISSCNANVLHLTCAKQTFLALVRCRGRSEVGVCLLVRFPRFK